MSFPDFQGTVHTGSVHHSPPFFTRLTPVNHKNILPYLYRHATRAVRSRVTMTRLKSGLNLRVGIFKIQKI